MILMIHMMCSDDLYEAGMYRSGSGDGCWGMFL